MNIRSLSRLSQKRSHDRRKFLQLRSERSRVRNLVLESLEDRRVMTVDLILDFDGGTLAAGNGYDIPTGGAGIAFGGFTAFSQVGGSGGNQTEQILQIVAGVREDFADFDVRVIWDDAGVNSPFFDEQDTVVMIVAQNGTSIGGGAGLFGIAANVDTNQSRRDTAFTFQPAHLDLPTAGSPLARAQIREIIDTISHEAGHTFGLSHSTTADAQQRQLVTTAGQDRTLDSRFSNTVLNHGAPEAGVMYRETDRLIANLGAAAAPAFETTTGQTLPADTALTNIATTNFASVNGNISFAGDRDAFRFVATVTGAYTIRQRTATSSAVAPVVTIWDANGDFKAVGSGGSVSASTFNLVAGNTYYAIAGTTYDRQAGNPSGATTGGFFLEISPSFLEFDSNSGVATVTGTDGNDTIVADRNGANLRLQMNGVSAEIPFASVTRLVVNGAIGNDTFSVDSTNGLLALTNGISFDGGAGFDGLNLRQTGGAPRTNGRVNVGANPGDGQSIIDTQVVNFQNIEPITDNVPATTFTLSSAPGIASLLDASNAINYGPAEILPAATWGRVTVDSFEPIEFINKTNLVIDAGAGSDTINLNNPNAPTGLTGITVSGGDPTASDTLIVNGSGANNTIGYSPSNTIGVGNVTIIGQPAVNFATIEHLSIDGAGGTDALTLTTPAGVHQVTYTPGSAPDSGVIAVRGAGLGTALVPLTFSHIGAFGSVSFASGAGVREDVLELNGTDDSENFNVDGPGNTVQIVRPNTAFVTDTLNTAGIQDLTLRGLNGDDTFNLTGGLLYTTVQVDAGSPSASDVVNLSAATGAVAVNLATFAVTGYGGIVSLLGVETLNANAAAQNLTINATAGNDSVTVDPTGAAAATVRLVSSSPAVSDPVINASGIGATFTVNLLGGSDTLRINGTQAVETIAVTPTTVTVGTLKAVTYSATTENLQVFGLGGSDTFNVTPSDTTTMFIDGGDPIGTSGDTLNLTPPGAFTLQPGPERDEGGLVGAGVQRVSWDHIEDVIIGGGSPGLILGTNGDDDITIIARDVSTHAGTDGVQDFTVTVNDSFSALFINQPTLFVDALAGDDDIVVRAPAPNNAEWGVDITLVGGPASSPTGAQGDLLEFEAPGLSDAFGFNTIIFTPTGPETGTFVLDQAVNDSTIAFVASFIFDPAGINYISSSGGIEHAVYDGVLQAPFDRLTINVPTTGNFANSTTDYYTATQSGMFRSVLSPSFDFSLVDTLTFNGFIGDVVNVIGSAGNDLVTPLADNAFAVESPGSSGVVILGSVAAGFFVDQLNLFTLGGSDNIDLDLNVPGLQKFVDAGDGDDIVNMSGTIDATILGGAGDDFLTGSPDYDSIDGGSGNDVIFGLAGNDDLYGGEGSDLIVGGAGADRMFGQDGADVLVWNPGDGSDLFEGGEGADILQFVGAAGIDNFTVSANGSRLRFDRVQGNIVIDAGGMEQVDVNSSISFGGALSGAQEVPPVPTAAAGQSALVFNSATGTFELQVLVQGITLAQLTQAHIHAGAVGVNGPVIFDLGTAGWSEVGGAIRRTVNLGLFPAANVADLLAGNTYVNIHTLTNPAGEIRGQLTAVSGAPNLNGADTFTVNDLFGTGVQVVNLGLGVADADAIDTVTINGRNVADNINLTNTTATRVAVTGLGYNVNIDGALTAAGGASSDILTINGNDGDDTISSPASLLAFFTNANLRLSGGLGDDTIVGNGATLNGNDGNDFLTGGTNDDVMDGGAGDDTFVGGGGTDNVGGGIGSSVGDTLLVTGTAGADTVNLSLNATGQLLATVNGVTTTYGNFLGSAFALGGIEQILVQGLAGNDSLTVNSTNGAVSVPITYDGGTNNDSLTLLGGTATANTYTVGPTADRGTSVAVIGGVTQTVGFLNIEPMVDLVAGPLTVVATNADNAINYSRGPNAGNVAAPFLGVQTGLVSVDGFETIEFSNKSTLTINALAGDDVINLNYQQAGAAPLVGPTGLGVGLPVGTFAITVNAGDPTASDKLIVNGTAAIAEVQTLFPTGTGAGNLVSLTTVGLAQVSPTVAYTGIEDLVLVMQGADGDGVRIAGTANNDVFEVTPGATPDAGQVTGTMGTGATSFNLPSIAYSGNTIATAAATGLPASVGALGINSGPVATQGGTDTVVYNGTGENDIFTVSNEGVTLSSAAWGGPNTPPVLLGSGAATSTTNIVINAGNGDDRINMVSATAGTETYDFNGGNPSAGSDTLALVDPAAIGGAPALVQFVTIAPDLVDPTQQDIFGYSANPSPIDVTGIELITYTAAPGAGGVRDDALFITPNADDDEMRISSQVAGVTARVTSQRLPQIHFTGLQFFDVDVIGTNPGVINATFVTQNLDPVTAYIINGGSEDILTIEGADTFPDNYVVGNPTTVTAQAGFPFVVDMSTAPGPVVTIASNFSAGVGPGFRPGEIRFNTKAGDDVVTIDVGGGGSLAGAVFPPALAVASVTPLDLVDTRIVYNGGTGGDLLRVVGTPATAVRNVVYTPGPDPTSGRIDYGTVGRAANLTGATLTGMMQVEFTGLQPVIDVIPANNLTVNASNANNVITYSQGPNTPVVAASTGLVAVDNNETIEFANKTVLTLNGLAGNDTITLANNAVAAPTGLTQIIVTGSTGDDVIDASSSTVATPLRLYGGVGNDTLVGGLGNDLYFGEQGNDILVDSPGADAFDGGNNGGVPAGFGFPALPAGVAIPAATGDPITATAGFDTIIIRGTGNNDVLAATQNAATAVAGAGYSLAIFNSASGGVTADVIASLGAADVPNAVASRPSVEEVRIEAGFGNDEIIVGHADAYMAASGTGAAPVLAAGAVPQQMVRFDVRGDAPNASDRLTIQDLGFGDLVLLRQSLDQRTGRVTVAPAVNTTTLGGFFGDVVYTGIEKVNITPINPLNGATGTNGLGQVVVFDTDPFEYNDNILNAEDIAHLELVTRNPNIDPGHNAALPVVTPAGNGDEDWYAFTADQNGTFTINTLFSAIPVAQPTIPGNRPGLPGNGLLTSALYNAIGAATAPLVVGSPLLGPTGALIGQQLQFAGVEGVTYYLRIVGLNATPNGLPAVGSVSTSLSVNTYDISLAQIDNLGPQVFDPDGANFPAQAIQIVDSPLYNLFDNKQVFNSQVAAAPAPTISAAGVVSFNVAANLPGLQIGQTVTFTSGVNAGLSDTITAINGNRLTFGTTTVGPTFVGASVFALPAAADAFFVGAPTPTPNVNGLTINFRDPISGTQVGVGPGAALGALDPATALNPGNYILRGDANGIIPIQNVRFAVPATGIIGGAVLAPVAGALNTTITLNAGAGLSVANGPIVGQTLQFTSGANAGLSGRITGYNAVTGEVRFASPFLGGAAAVGDTFIISPSPIVISPTPVLTTASVTAASTNVVVNLGVGAVTGAGLSTVAGTYVGQALQIISGALAGETRTITAYNGAGVFTVSGAVVANGFSAAPAVGTVFNIVGTPVAATSTVAAATVPDSILGGAGLSAVNGFYDGQALQFTSGPLSGQSRVITAYTVVPGVGPVFAFANGFTAAPAVGNAFVIVPAAPASLANAVQAVFAGQGRFAGGLGGVLGAGLDLTSQVYLGQVLQFTSGVLAGQAQVITDYANGIFAFGSPFSANPAVGDTFNILPVNVAAITLDFASPLPDDRYTLTVSDEIRDFVGNQLDGNSGASQPTGSPVFPSGDGVNGGDFIARFNVDSRPELGTWAAGSMWADINGNQTFDPSNTDFTNRDFAYLLGFTSDELFAGNFADVSGTFADGFDKIAAYGRVGSQWRWMIDTDNDGVPNINQVDPAGINGYPMSGDFAPALPGDEVGLFTGTTWFLDIDGDFVLNDGALGVRQLGWTRLGAQVNGHGFTGDFDGDGAVDLGSWSNDLFSLSLSSLSGGLVDGVVDTQFSFGFPGVRERPVAADMNRDGIDDIGLWNPDRATQIDGQAGEWYWLVSGIVTNDTPTPGGLPPFPATLGPTIPQRVVADPITAGRNIVAFTTTPFGNDLYMQYGDAFSLPIVGNFDPPAGQPSTHGLTNTRNALDVDNDGLITALDALTVINQLNISVIPEVPTGGFLRAPFLDVDGDSSVTALDALALINWLNDNPVDSAGESFAPASAGEATDFDEDLLILLAIEQNERDRD